MTSGDVKHGRKPGTTHTCLELTVPNSPDGLRGQDVGLRANLPRLRARSILVTHLGDTAFSKIDEIRAAGIGVAEDGLIREL